MNVLFVGLGSIAAKHIHFLRGIDPAVKLFALRSANRSAIPDVVNVVSVPLLKEIEIDFIVVSNPTSLHVSTIEELITLGKPFFIEKPFASSIEEASRAVSLLKRQHVTAYVAYPLRFHPLLRELKKIVTAEQAKIEEVNVYNGSYLPRWRKDSDYRNSYSADPAMGGGVHLDMSHEIDLVCWLFGRPTASTCYLQSKSSLGIKSYDYANYLLTYPDFTASIVLNYFRTVPRRTFEIIFSNKVVITDILKGTISVDNEIIYQFKGDINDMYAHQLEYFIDGITSEGKQLENNPDEALDVLSFILPQ
jgi:predicted dehydrogenase